MSQSTPNPFQAPIKTAVESQTQATGKEGLDFIVIAKKWEGYRLIYNSILVFETVTLGCLASAVVGLQPLIALLLVAVAGALAVNFFFFLGPAFDGYCQWIFDSRSKTFGLIILVLGTLFSMFLAGITVVAIVSNAIGPILPGLDPMA